MSFETTVNVDIQSRALRFNYSQPPYTYLLFLGSTSSIKYIHFFISIAIDPSLRVILSATPKNIKNVSGAPRSFCACLRSPEKREKITPVVKASNII